MKPEQKENIRSTCDGSNIKNIKLKNVLTQILSQVHSAVYRYLQRRRYAPAVTDAYRRISHPPKEYLSQTKQAMALRELLQNEASSNNSFSFLSHNSDPVVIEQQYSRFKVTTPYK